MRRRIIEDATSSWPLVASRERYLVVVVVVVLVVVVLVIYNTTPIRKDPLYHGSTNIKT